jgi:ATPase subunit of ABC transporter with duplicated ATPase domains
MIAVSRLTKTLGGLIAVQDVSFEVRKGKIPTFLGPNEAGKTTIVSILTFPDQVFYRYAVGVFSPTPRAWAQAKCGLERAAKARAVAEPVIESDFKDASMRVACRPERLSYGIQANVSNEPAWSDLSFLEQLIELASRHVQGACEFIRT